MYLDQSCISLISPEAVNYALRTLDIEIKRPFPQRRQAQNVFDLVHCDLTRETRELFVLSRLGNYKLPVGVPIQSICDQRTYYNLRGQTSLYTLNQVCASSGDNRRPAEYMKTC